jgi:hypothetical protein
MAELATTSSTKIALAAACNRIDGDSITSTNMANGFTTRQSPPKSSAQEPEVAHVWVGSFQDADARAAAPTALNF